MTEVANHVNAASDAFDALNQAVVDAERALDCLAGAPLNNLAYSERLKINHLGARAVAAIAQLQQIINAHHLE